MTDAKPARDLVAIKGYCLPVSDKTVWIMLEAVLADGTSGFGEATAFGAEAAISGEIDRLAASIAANPIAPIGPALSRLSSAPVSQARRQVLIALEQALFDAVARHAGLPLSVLLGGPFSDRVPVYANINRGIADRSPDGFAAAAKAVCAQGYSSLKIAPFDGLHWNQGDISDRKALFANGAARVHSVREAVGPGVDILVDCHFRFDPALARYALDALADASPYWIEDPVDCLVHDGEIQRSLRASAHRLGMRIAGGEHVRTLADARALFGIGGYDVILPDLRLTGLRRGMTILEVAASHGVAASLHNPVGPVLDAVSVQVALAVPNFLILERQVNETPLFDALRGGPAPLAGGALVAPDGQGLGFLIDRTELNDRTKVR